MQYSSVFVLIPLFNSMFNLAHPEPVEVELRAGFMQVARDEPPTYEPDSSSVFKTVTVVVSFR